MPPPVADFAAHSLTYGGGTVETLRAGDGPPVVLVHASGMSAGRWARLAGQWTDRYTVYAPQLVGYGETGPFDPTRWTLADDVAAIEAVVDAARAERGQRVHLVGHSYGGWLCLQLARRRPDALASLGLYEPTTFGLLHEADDAEGLADLARFYDDPWFLDPAQRGTDAWLGAFVDYWNQAEFWQVMGPAQRAPLRAIGAKVFAEVSAVLADRTGAAAWTGITTPTRVLLGVRTTPAADRATRLLASVMPGAELVEIARAGHMAPLVRVGPIGKAFAEHFHGHGERHPA